LKAGRRASITAQLFSHELQAEKKMFLEIVRCKVKVGSEKSFEAAFMGSKWRVENAKGCGGVELQRGVDHPGEYYVLVKWARIEDHIVDFRNSQAGHDNRMAFQSFLAETPHVEHCVLVTSAP
jgi:heme-degrading monooxygenase HmoA